MHTPRPPFPVYTPPPEPGVKPASMAEKYLQGLARIGFDHMFVAETPERADMARAALARPAARITLVMPGRQDLDIALSSPVPDTDLAFISIGGTIGVVSFAGLDTWAPDIAFFFDPEQVKDKQIEW
jgi:hypothetical protein